VIVLVCLESQPSLASRAALRLACNLGERAEVVVVSAGGTADSASFQLARQYAAVRRIVHLNNPTLNKADFVTLGMILAETARQLGARVIFTGEHSDGEGQGMVPAALAHHLRTPLFARVAHVQLPARDNEALRLTVHSGGRLCTVTSPLPAVLATPPAIAADGANSAEARHSSPTVETLTLAQLGMDASRLVPRPNLLGTLVAKAAQTVQYKSFDEAAHILLQGR
jgi:electron transfer flavoprotein beta subunit